MSALGLDVGGTKISAGLVDLDGTATEVTTTPTIGSGQAVVDQVASIIDGYRAAHPVETVGLVVPGGVDPRTGVVTAASNLGWRNLDLLAALRPRLPPSVALHVDNDANAAAWAEHRFGGHRLEGSLVLVTVGTGIGGGIVIDGRVVQGLTGAGGEVGHLPLHPGGRACECGSSGCWEQYASGRALHRAAQAAGWDSETAGHDVLRAAGEGNEVAAVVVGEVAAQLGHGITVLTAVLDPALVLLGGGLGTDPLFQAFVQDAASAVAVTPPRSRVPIGSAALGVLAGVIGAADLARRIGGEVGVQ
ncbi:ROK family protein [Umezawaea sp. Da 62-37]|uniref:ROK family protein n=1 Tax=Umezawaea sp. Da 62-37 TaxID=3075927 RepID=UPI0028F6C7C2|nr:ROK family protein [Umezawaea sp. Da 62-37]WNV86002.1 ROK family protein [Umezawaea sp. Da 62-37]